MERWGFLSARDSAYGLTRGSNRALTLIVEGGCKETDWFVASGLPKLTIAAALYRLKRLPVVACHSYALRTKGACVRAEFSRLELTFQEGLL